MRIDTPEVVFQLQFIEKETLLYTDIFIQMPEVDKHYQVTNWSQAEVELLIQLLTESLLQEYSSLEVPSRAVSVELYKQQDNVEMTILIEPPIQETNINLLTMGSVQQPEKQLYAIELELTTLECQALVAQLKQAYENKGEK